MRRRRVGSGRVAGFPVESRHACGRRVGLCASEKHPSALPDEQCASVRVRASAWDGTRRDESVFASSVPRIPDASPVSAAARVPRSSS